MKQPLTNDQVKNRLASAKLKKPLHYGTAKAMPGMFDSLLATAKAAIAETQSLRDQIAATYDEFKRLDVDPTTLSPADREEYRHVMDTLRKQRVALER